MTPPYPKTVELADHELGHLYGLVCAAGRHTERSIERMKPREGQAPQQFAEFRAKKRAKRERLTLLEHKLAGELVERGRRDLIDPRLTPA